MLTGISLPRTVGRWAGRWAICSLAVATGLAAPTVHAQSPTLRQLADDADLEFGAAVDVGALGDASYRELVANSVNLLSTRDDLTMAVVQPEQGTFDFTRADLIVDFAVDGGVPVRGHDLIGATVPAWVSSGSWTPDSLSQVLRDHITAVVGHFRDRNPGVITQWDVVGDAVLPDGTPRPNIWRQVIGDDYIRIAFQAARAADPSALLFYDDFYDDLAVTQDAVASGVPIVAGATAERSSCDQIPKCVGVRDRLSALVGQGTPIDGVGFQAHLFSPDPADFGQLTTWVGDLGLAWAVTEFDVPLPITEIDDEASRAFQATVYADALASCLDAANCDTFVTWGVTDRFSPIPNETGGAFGGALWFDAADAPKPAFDAMVTVLTDRAAPPETTTPQTAPLSIPATSQPVETGDSSNNAPLALGIGVASLAVIAGVVLVRRRRSTPPAP